MRSWTDTYHGSRNTAQDLLKAEAVLAPVGEVLGLVPLESQTFHAIIIIMNL
jgi:hypothetical protein